MPTKEFEIETESDVHLTFNNQNGSVEHYYHFLLGFFIPMVLACERLIATGKIRNIYVRSCATFDNHIRAAGYPEVIIVDKAVHSEMTVSMRVPDGTYVPLKFFSFEGYDEGDKYIYKDFSAATSILNTRFAKELQQAKSEIESRRRKGGTKIVLINRGQSHEFFSSDNCELKSSGKQRRSIANFQQLQERVLAIFPNTLIEMLEEKSLVYQIALFNSADIIIAQHGAALSNLIWCTPATTLIEILPDNILGGRNGKSCFTHLASCMSMQYHTIRQNNRHGQVDVKSVLNSLLSINSFPSVSVKPQAEESFPASKNCMRFSPDLYPVYGDEYELVVHKDEFYVQGNNNELVIKLNPSAACIFNYCLGHKSIAEIVDEVSTLHAREETISAIFNDVEIVLAELIEKEVVELSEHRPFPDFLIIGAMKSGTSALDINLCYHPDVFMAHQEEWKEMQFFHARNWQKGPVWYRQHFTRKGKLQGEKSPGYLYDEQSLIRMCSLLPDAKLIILLRDPVTRAYSHWNHLNQIPEESKYWGWQVCEFEKCIESDPDVLARGNYVKQLEFLFQLYPRSQVYIGITEKFRTHGLLEYEKVCKYLGVSMTATEYKNVHVRTYDSAISEDMIKVLTDHYRPYNEALFELLGYRIEEWL